MREKFQHFMQGRYGADQLSRFLTTIGLVLIILNLFVRSNIIVYLVMAILVYCYYRMFSRDYNRRYAENQKFLTWQNKIKYKVNNWKRNLADRKTHHIYKCPSCGQKIRVPRGKGKIIVTCLLPVRVLLPGPEPLRALPPVRCLLSDLRCCRPAVR